MQCFKTHSQANTKIFLLHNVVLCYKDATFTSFKAFGIDNLNENI